MKTGIHPEHKLTRVKCTCGNEFEILSAEDSLSVDICSACHPFYTGTQKFVDSAGRVDAFTKRFQWTAEEAKKKAKERTKAVKKQPRKDLKTELEKKKVFGKKKILPEPTDDKGKRGKKG